MYAFDTAREKGVLLQYYKRRKLQLFFPCLTEFLNNYVSTKSFE